ncbi:PREDICTED: nuclear pore complex protein Nup107-like [Acropora digitifera]|uniref:nuclear pore complex protein Nup107-like n=1 Tax=Acropora digitifera TaxID=70779 RepID=UPI00077A092B|nr:PREDICTED: nuclear pore complex protein Nup107-like [Acropora digitifera]
MATPRMPLHTASSLLRKANTPSPLRQLPLSSMVGALSETEFDLTSEHGSYLSEGLGPLSSQPPPISMLGSLSFMETGGSGQPLIPNEPLTPHNAQDFALRSTEDLSQFTGNVTVSFAKDPLDADSSRLYEEFMNAMTSSPDTQQIFDVIANYQKACREHRRRLNRLIRQTTPEKTKFSHQVDIEDLISQESYTWRLIGSLYSDRLQNGTSDEEVVLPEFVGKHWSEKTIVEKLYEMEASTRQSQIVIDWLEKNAEDWLEIFLEAETVEYFSESVYWENTLHALKQGGGNLGRRRPLVTEMDPDAPGRQNRPLHDLDQAQDLCERSNQYWRAASLEGWKLWHDPNMNGGLENTALAVTEGNENRDLWKKCCWGLCEKLLPVCKSWEDYLWAFFKVMVDVRVEQVIRLHPRAGNPLENLPPEFWDQNLNPEKIFEEIGACPVESVRRHSNDFHHVIQRHIILNDTNGDEAHLVLFLKSAGIESETDPDHCVAILKAYVQVLIDEKQIDLVATYTATLPPEIQTRTYAYFLEGIDDAKQRQKCLDLADSVGMDDRKKIEAIEWLMFHRSQRSEALKQSNAIIRCFIATRKHAAAREVFQKIPPDSIDVIHKQWELTGGSTALPPGDDNAIKEYLCIRAYLEAMDGFDYWFQHFHQSVPLKPRHEEYTNFTEKVAFEQRLKDYEVLVLQEEEEDSSRTHQLQLLRQLCLPLICFLLHKVLHSTEQYKQCVKIADVVASEQYQLYKVFRKDELQKMLSLLRDTSLEALGKNLDPLGYDMEHK